jgi:hypothetical protein
MFLEYLLSSAMLLVPVGSVGYLAWCLVRALEHRKGASVQVLDMVTQVRALRTEVTLLASELAELESPRGAVLDRSSADRPVPGKDR